MAAGFTLLLLLLWCVCAWESTWSWDWRYYARMAAQLGSGLRIGNYAGIPGCIAMDKLVSTSCFTLRYWHIYMSLRYDALAPRPIITRWVCSPFTILTYDITMEHFFLDVFFDV